MARINYNVSLRILDNGKNFPYYTQSGSVEVPDMDELGRRLNPGEIKDTILAHLKSDKLHYRTSKGYVGYDELLKDPDFVSLNVYGVEVCETVDEAKFTVTALDADDMA